MDLIINKKNLLVWMQTVPQITYSKNPTKYILLFLPQKTDSN